MFTCFMGLNSKLIVLKRQKQIATHNFTPQKSYQGLRRPNIFESWYKKYWALFKFSEKYSQFCLTGR